MEGTLPKENTQFVVISFIEQHNLVPSKIIAKFAQIEPNIIVVDNTHAIKSVALGTKDILKLDNLEVMTMGTNKKGERMHWLQKVLLIIAQEDPSPPWLIEMHRYYKVGSNKMAKRGESPISFLFFPFVACVGM